MVPGLQPGERADFQVIQLAPRILGERVVNARPGASGCMPSNRVGVSWCIHASTAMALCMMLVMPLKVSELLKLIEDDGWYLAAIKGSHRQYRHPHEEGPCHGTR